MPGKMGAVHKIESPKELISGFSNQYRIDFKNMMRFEHFAQKMKRLCTQKVKVATGLAKQ
jgi:hypothetical protein